MFKLYLTFIKFLKNLNKSEENLSNSFLVSLQKLVENL